MLVARLLVGEPLQTASLNLLAEVAALSVTRAAPLVSSASPIQHGAMLRVAGESVESVGKALHHHLKFVTALLGDDPWARKW